MFCKTAKGWLPKKIQPVCWNLNLPVTRCSKPWRLHAKTYLWRVKKSKNWNDGSYETFGRPNHTASLEINLEAWKTEVNYVVLRRADCTRATSKRVFNRCMARMECSQVIKTNYHRPQTNTSAPKKHLKSKQCILQSKAKACTSRGLRFIEPTCHWQILMWWSTSFHPNKFCNALAAAA